MSFDNDYPNRKDKRKKYYRSKRFDRSCHPRGSCPYCACGRAFPKRKLREHIRELINDWLNECKDAD